MILATLDSDMAPVTEGATLNASSHDRAADNQLRADIAELLFCVEARKRGYRVRLLGGTCQGYDVILERDDMRPLFIQVKHGFLASDGRQGRSCQSYRIPNFSRSGCAYGPHSYDILAFYMWDREQWLLFRRCEFGNRTQTRWLPPEVRQRARSANAKIDDRDPNNWELLDDVSQSLTNLEGRTADVLP